MTLPKPLPGRPSLESLRKQAKKLARDVAAGDAGAIARASLHLPNVNAPLTQRNAQFVLAREYGYDGWQALTAEVSKRLGNSLHWAAAQARRIIHDNDVDGLKQLLAEYPALLSWQGDNAPRGLLGIATGAYGDAFDPNRERSFTRAACAELLIDAGAAVVPSVCVRILDSRARGLLQLFQRKGLLPHTIDFLAALGDIDAVRASLAEGGHDRRAITDAFMRACSFEHDAVASLMLDRAIALDRDLGTHVADSGGPMLFIKSIIENRMHYFAQPRIDGVAHETPAGPWQVFVMQHVKRAIHDRDLAAFAGLLQRERWLLADACVGFQAGLIGQAALQDRGEFITALLDLDPAILQRQPPPPSQAIEFALTYGHASLIPLLTRLWPLPDDLAHAAGTGNLARVKRWFDDSGTLALGDPNHHYPYNDPRARKDLHWHTPTEQQVLDTALAFAVVNRHFDVADFLLAHGADINTRWNSHEPASILHHLVFEDNYESMQFLIDRGIDMTIEDYRWNSTARGWAFYGKNDERMAQWLADAERRRAQTTNR